MLNEIATRDHLPLPNCNSDSKAKNKRQRTVVWLIYHHSECEEEVIFVNFPCALEKFSCPWASVDPLECASRYTAFTQPPTTLGRPGNEVVLHIAQFYACFTSLVCFACPWTSEILVNLCWTWDIRIGVEMGKTGKHKHKSHKISHKSDKAHKEDLKEGKGSRKN